MNRATTLAVVLAVAAIGVTTSYSRATAGNVSIDVHVGVPTPLLPPPVVVVPPPPPPRVIVIEPGAPAWYYDGQYFRFYNGTWFVARHHEGPWVYVPIARVPPPVVVLPGAADRRPPGHMKEPGPPPWARGRGAHGRDRD